MVKTQKKALYSKEGREEYFFNRLKDPKTGQIPSGIRHKELEFAKSLPANSAKNSGQGEWISRGPNNLGGRTRAFTFDIDDSDILIAGGVTAGIYKSYDGGTSFEKKTRADQLHSVTSIEQDRRAGHRDVWYAGTGEYYAIVSAASFSARASGNGIYKSTDSGESWELLPSTISNTPTSLHSQKDFDFVWRIVTDHTALQKDIVYAAVVNGIFRSEDGGQNWDVVLGLDTTVNGRSDYTDIMITESGVLYATIGSGTPSRGIYRSVDGINWTNITPQAFPGNYRRIVLDYFEADENKICFLAETPNAGKNGHSLWYYQYLSGDGSGSNGQWDNRSSNLPDYNCNYFYDFVFGTFQSQRSYDLAIALHPQDSNIIAIGGIDLFISTDGFKSNNNYNWIGGYQCDTVTPSNYVYTNHHPDIHLIRFHPDSPDILVTGSDGGLHKTENYLANKPVWIDMNTNYVTSQFYTTAIEPGEVSNDILVGGLQDNGTWFTNSGDFNSPWNSVFYGDGAFCEILPSRNNYYLSWQTGKIFKFEIDDSGNVLGKTRIDPAGSNFSLFIHPFLIDPVTYNQMYTPKRRHIYVQEDLDSIVITGNETDPISQGWRRIDESNAGFSIFDPASSNGNITALDMSSADNDRLYYGTDDGRLFRLDSLQSTTALFTALWDTVFPNAAYVSSIAVSERNTDEVIVSFSNYNVQSIFRSTDAGETWTSISGNLEENPDGSGDGPAVFWVEYLHKENGADILYAGTSTGLYSLDQLDNAPYNWMQEGVGSIGNIPVNMIKTRAFDEKVVVATHGNGMYSTRFKNIASVADLNIENEALVLHQNRPNPFDQQTKIKFKLATAEQLELSVFDMQGKSVKNLFSGKLNAGTYSFDWNGKNEQGNDMAPGMYIYRLSNGTQSWSNQMIKF
ncbi:MAG: FlgD immunoglobulin-like domain containing protein [Chitinophagales bacterium]